MKKKYMAAFLVPTGADKVLGEDGWEFESAQRISNDVVDHLIAALGLDFVEMYSGIKRYINDDMGMSIFLDEDNEVENIYFQVFGGSLKALAEVCQGLEVPSEVELFVPQQG